MQHYKRLCPLCTRTLQQLNKLRVLDQREPGADAGSQASDGGDDFTDVEFEEVQEDE